VSQPDPNAGQPPRWRRWLLEAAIFLVLFTAFQLWQLRDAARGPAPAFSATQTDGSPFDLADWRAEHPGQPVLLYFWADWCPVCKTTAGSVGNLAADWPVMGIASQSGTSAKLAQTMSERGYAFPSLSDPGGGIQQQYRLPGVPAFVVIDPAGNISALSVGYTSEIGLRLRLWLAARNSS
jgi:peroxiredoxin